MSDSELISSYDSDSEIMDTQRRHQLFGQISELQNAVTDMKSAFTTAIQQLGTFQQEDQGLWEKVEENKIESQNQISEVLKLMLSLKAEFATLKSQVQMSNESQQNLQRQVQSLVWERDLLIEELYKSGSISEQIRYHLQNSQHQFVGRAPSGTYSNDSGVAMFNEKIHPAFQTNSFLVSSDQESVSLSEPSTQLVSPMVHDYVVGLNKTDNCGLIAYDSDSSLINAANKSLTLSSSLGKQCGLELDHWEGNTDDDGEDTTEDGTKLNFEASDETEHAIMSLKQSNNRERYRENQRRAIVKKILETERRYCKTLRILHETFAEPLKRSSIVSAKDSNTLFPEEVYQFYENHSILLRKLEVAANCNIGDIFDKFTDPMDSNILQLYTSYVDDFPEVLKTFHKLCRRKNRKFTSFLKSCLIQPECGGLDLGVFLVAPVQRIPYYSIFLKKLLRVTAENHPDWQHLTNCLQRLKDFLDRLNDTMEHSFQLIVSQIQPENDRSHPDRSAKSVVWKKAAAQCRDVDKCSEMQALDLHAAKKSKSKDSMNSDCGSTSGSSSKSNSGRNYGHKPRAGRRNKCNYPTSQAVERPYRSRSCGETLAGERNCFDAKISNSQSPRLSSGQWMEESLQSQPNSLTTEDSESLISKKRGSSESLNCDAGYALDAEFKDDEWPNGQNGISSKSGRFCASKSMPDVKQNANILSSEPNLADPNTSESVAQDCQHCTKHYCCTMEKGASLACIVPSCTDLRNEGEGGSPNRSCAKDRPLAKAQSSHAVHHHHCPPKEHRCSLTPSHCSVSNIGSDETKNKPPKIPASAGGGSASRDKKKISIRASLKNLLLFKKRGSGSRIRSSASAGAIGMADSSFGRAVGGSSDCKLCPKESDRILSEEDCPSIEQVYCHCHNQNAV